MDFFGSKKEEQPKTPTVNIQKTGKFIDGSFFLEIHFILFYYIVIYISYSSQFH